MSRVELTRRGWALLGAAVGLVAASRLLATAELAVLGVGALALLGLTLAWVRRGAPTLQVVRSVRPARLHCGGDARIDLRATATTSSPEATLTDSFDGGRRTARFLVGALEAGAVARAAYRVPTARRGRFVLGPASATTTDPFGLAAHTRTVAGVDEVVVWPRVHEIRPALPAPGRRHPLPPSAARFRAAAVGGEEFLTLRQYAVGDDLRRIHWRSSARTGELVVRQDEAHWQPETRIVLDTRAAGPAFEQAVEVAASVVATTARAGLPLTVLTADGRDLGRTWLAVMDRLADIEGGGPTTPLPVAARAAPAGLTVFVTDRVRTADLEALARRGSRQAPIVLVATDGVGHGASTSRLIAIDGRPHRFAAAWDRAMLGRARARRRVGT